VRLPRRISERKLHTRLEAFSDGVFAIAITLLVLEIRLPEARIEAHGGLAAALGAQAVIGGYAISFVTICIMWANHAAAGWCAVGSTS